MTSQWNRRRITAALVPAMVVAGGMVLLPPRFATADIAVVGRIGGDKPSARALMEGSKALATSSLAAELDVSLDRARELMAAQESLHSVATDGDLGFVQLVPTYTKEGVRVKYLSTSKVLPDQVVKAFGALPDVSTEFIQVPFSISELSKAGMQASEALAVAADPALSAKGGAADSTLSPADGSVVFFTAQPVSDQTKVQVARAATPATVKWEVAEVSVPLTGGGGAMTSCTGGYTVKVIGGSNTGISTAGHCNNYQTYTGVTLNTMAEAYGGNADLEWADNVSVNWDPSIWLGGPSNYPVQSRKNWDNVSINDSACFYGKSTGGGCAEIRDIYFKPASPANATYSFGVLGQAGAPGDSGGPVYYGLTAWGLVGGGTSSWIYFTPQNRLETRLGVQVMIQ